MDSEKRNLFLAIAICIGILVVWQSQMAPQRPAPGQKTASEQTDGDEGDDDEGFADDSDGVDDDSVERATVAAADAPDGSATTETAQSGQEGDETSGEAETAEDKPAPAPSRGPEQEFVLEDQHARYVFSNWGATLKETYLKGDKYLASDENGDPIPGEPLEIVRSTEDERRPLTLRFPRSGFKLPKEAIWKVTEQSEKHLVFETRTDTVAITKTLDLREEAFRLKFNVKVENLGPEEQKHGLSLHLYGRQDPKKQSSGFYDYATASLEEMTCFVNGDVERNPIENLRKEKVDVEGTVQWIAADERFFTIAAVPPAQTGKKLRKCGQRFLRDDDDDAPLGAYVFLAFPRRTLEKGESANYPFELYIGPKYRNNLTAVTAPVVGDAAAEEGPQLDKVVNVTFAFLSRPMLFLLKLFFKLTGNWGLAIVLLTVLVRIATFLPTHKQLVSGKKMARLAPKMKELKKKYGDDRERMGRETMAMYKAHGVNPLGGCLPALIQMPIWIALFSTLQYSVELYRTEMGLHISDLSAPDPYKITPLLMGAVMFIQMRMSPTGADPQQQKMMAIMMPIMFTGFQLFLPAGLSVYMLTSYVLGIAHQLWVNHLDRKENGPIVPAGAGAKA